jgi:hypothetical protein
MTIMPRTLALALLAALIGACGGPARKSAPPTVDSPTPAAHADQPCSPERIGEGDQAYLRDCAPVLAREYYVVAINFDFVSVIPQPVRTQALLALCADATGPGEEAARRGWCSNDLQEKSMTIDDAIAMARFLHRHLRFVANGRGIEPSPNPVDIVDACVDVDPSSDLGNACEAYGPHKFENVYRPSAAGAVAMAAALNELYGIGD